MPAAACGMHAKGPLTYGVRDTRQVGGNAKISEQHQQRRHHLSAVAEVEAMGQEIAEEQVWRAEKAAFLEEQINPNKARGIFGRPARFHARTSARLALLRFVRAAPLRIRRELPAPRATAPAHPNAPAPASPTSAFAASGGVCACVVIAR